MKKLFILFYLTAVLLTECKSTPQAEPVPETLVIIQDFSDVKDREWNLMEIRINGKDIEFNRDALEKEGFRDVFTIIMDDQTISGTGAPNRYSAPYTLGEGQEINVQLVRATLMATIREPEKLREHDFFTYIQNTYEWKTTDSNLELKSKTAKGEDVVMVLN